MTKQIAICQDNSHTWRNTLTVGKAYDIVRLYPDPHAGYDIIEIRCDDDDIHPYRADRFVIQG